jgi:hypothetical protein
MKQSKSTIKKAIVVWQTRQGLSKKEAKAFFGKKKC